MLNKQERLQLICDMITAHPINTQAEIVERLEAAGIPSTQATVSRDMKNLGIIKIPVEGNNYIYGLPKASLDLQKQTESHYINEIKRRREFLHLNVDPGTAMILKKQIGETYAGRLFSLISDDDSLLMIANTEADAMYLETVLKEW